MNFNKGAIIPKHQPKPCPRCYTPMKPTNTGHTCTNQHCSAHNKNPNTNPNTNPTH